MHFSLHSRVLLWQGIEAAKRTIEFPAAPPFFSSKKWIKLIPKTIGNRKRDCASGCAQGINTTWENLQIEKHKSGRRSFSSPDWFVLFDLQIFSGGVYPPSATSRTISFSISNSFGINFICNRNPETREKLCDAVRWYRAAVVQRWWRGRLVPETRVRSPVATHLLTSLNLSVSSLAPGLQLDSRYIIYNSTVHSGFSVLRPGLLDHCLAIQVKSGVWKSVALKRPLKNDDSWRAIKGTRNKNDSSNRWVFRATIERSDRERKWQREVCISFE